MTYLELFVDWYAYCGSQLVNPKAGRTKPLSTAADYTSSFAAALRSFHKVFAEKVPPHPATCCLVSHLTAFNMLKQATGLNMRPRFRCPSAVGFLTWSLGAGVDLSGLEVDSAGLDSTQPGKETLVVSSFCFEHF